LVLPQSQIQQVLPDPDNYLALPLFTKYHHRIKLCKNILHFTIQALPLIIILGWEESMKRSPIANMWE
jgi:hypothetical protein